MFTEEGGKGERKRRRWKGTRKKGKEKSNEKSQQKEKIVKNQIKIISLTKEWTFFFILFLNCCFPISDYFLNYFCLLNRFFFFSFTLSFRITFQRLKFKTVDWYMQMYVYVSYKRICLYACTYQCVCVRVCLTVRSVLSFENVQFCVRFSHTVPIQLKRNISFSQNVIKSGNNPTLL